MLFGRPAGALSVADGAMAPRRGNVTKGLVADKAAPLEGKSC
jgi:hypothetical protein